MKTLTGKTIFLRALEPTDLDFLYKVENEEAIWEVSDTITPYSRYLLKDYLANSYKDIYEAKQLRLAITELRSKNVLGFIDLYDFDPKNKRAGVGVIIFDKAHRNKGIGKEVLSIMTDYCFNKLGLHQLYANIGEQNKVSIQLFKYLGFKEIGVKKDWRYTANGYEDEILFQKINN